jgi:hypothetical protein
MTKNLTELDKFNRRMDELVENVISRNLVSPEYRAEYVKAAGLYRRVAEYDPRLAQEFLLSTTMLTLFKEERSLLQDV